MVDEANYDNDDLLEEDDLMEEDDLLTEDLEQVEAVIAPAQEESKQINTAPSESEIGKKLSARPSPLAPFDQTTESRPALTPSSKSRPSPAKKKRSSPSPIATGVSLRQRNLMGRASGKARVSRIGPNLQQCPLSK